jgi:hypothetical protein
MTATEDSEVVPAMLEGENDPVLESADDVTANHTVTFLSPQEPGTATLRCDSEETIDPTEIPTEEGTPSGDETEPTSDGATPAESGDEEGSDDEPTTEVVPSEELTVSWLG